jgi:hypothetical protein
MVKCPWCNEWEGPPAKYSDHLKYCKKYPPNYEAMKEQAQVRPIETTRRTYTWRGPYHRYVDFQIATCLPSIPEDVKKGLEEDLKDPNSEIRRDIRKLFEPSPPGEYELGVLMPPYKYLGVTAGCIIKFRKIR